MRKELDSLIQDTVRGMGHYRNWYNAAGVEIWIAWRFCAPIDERRQEFDERQKAIDWLNANPFVGNTCE